MKEEWDLRVIEKLKPSKLRELTSIFVTVYVLPTSFISAVFLNYTAEASVSRWDTENSELVISCAFQYLKRGPVHLTMVHLSRIHLNAAFLPLLKWPSFILLPMGLRVLKEKTILKILTSKGENWFNWKDSRFTIPHPWS